MRRDAIGQFKERSEPHQLGVPEQLHFDPIVGARHDGANRNDKDVQKLMPLRPVNPGIFQARKMISDRSRSLSFMATLLTA
jgi:hypothetical protein